MRRFIRLMAACALVLFSNVSHADEYSDATALFRNSSESASFFKNSYGYAIFPTVGEGGFVVGGGYGTGHVYVHGQYVGDASITQVSVGSQVGAQAFSQIVFFENKRAYDAFTSGKFEFGADASAVAITAGAEASVGTKGASAGASTSKKDAGTMGRYHKGMAVFTIVKGGAMVQAALTGQKFGYTPKGR